MLIICAVSVGNWTKSTAIMDWASKSLADSKFQSALFFSLNNWIPPLTSVVLFEFRGASYNRVRILLVGSANCSLRNRSRWGRTYSQVDMMFPVCGSGAYVRFWSPIAATYVTHAHAFLIAVPWFSCLGLVLIYDFAWCCDLRLPCLLNTPFFPFRLRSKARDSAARTKPTGRPRFRTSISLTPTSRQWKRGTLKNALGSLVGIFIKSFFHRLLVVGSVAKNGPSDYMWY